MKTILRYIAIVSVIFIALSALVSFLSTAQKATTISLSELTTKINNREVKEIIVKNDQLQVTSTSGEHFITKKESNVGTTETLTDLGAQKDKLSAVRIEVQDPSGTSIFINEVIPSVLPFLLLVLIFWYMFKQAQKGSMQAFSFSKSKARLANSTGKKRITFKDVAGLIEAKEEVVEIVEFLRDPQKFQKLGARIPRGVLLVGSPGTGKTLLAKAVANEANVPFYFVSGSEFVEMFVGVGANRVRDTFELAKKTAPAIIFIDEIDAVGRQRGTGMGGGHDEREQTLNQILVEMDGFDTNDAVIIMAATNRPDILDPALLRPGRFDRRIIMDEPSLKDREAILQIHAAEKPMSEDVNMTVVAERTPGFSGADLANLINEAAILAARKNQKVINQLDLFQAIEKVILGPERRSHVLSKREKEITAYHEAGHALVAVSMPHSDPVHKISIVSRGRAGGYTLKLPSEDKHMKTRAEFEAELAVLLGGYTAEKLIFKDLTTGASNDLKVAAELARKMVTQYGMSEKIGPMTYGEKEEMVFLGHGLGSQKNYSETVAYQIDQEVSGFIDRAFESAKQMLSEKIETLHKIAKELIEKETLEQKEFYALIK